MVTISEIGDSNKTQLTVDGAVEGTFKVVARNPCGQSTSYGFVAVRGEFGALTLALASNVGVSSPVDLTLIYKGFSFKGPSFKRLSFELWFTK